MIENEIYCYVNGFLKWDISKKTGYIICLITGYLKGNVQDHN